MKHMYTGEQDFKKITWNVWIYNEPFWVLNFWDKNINYAYIFFISQYRRNTGSW